MKTDELIRALAADRMRSPAPGRRLLATLPIAVAVAGALLLGIIGLRPDLAQVLLSPLTAMKNLLPLVLGGVALWLALGLARPGQRGRTGWLLIFAAAAAVLFLGQLSLTPPGEWGAGIMGQTAAICVPAIFLTALLPLAAILLSLRYGASTAPARSGFLAGLGSGGIATALYALHCTEDNPLFFVTWYGLAILLVAGLGAAVGSRLLRW